MTTAPGAAAEPDPTAGPPTVRVLKGRPSDAELVALVVALRTLPAAPTTTGPLDPAGPVSHWVAQHRRRGHELRPGPDAWRRSLR